jgi:histone H3/H4
MDYTSNFLLSFHNSTKPTNSSRDFEPSHQSSPKRSRLFVTSGVHAQRKCHSETAYPFKKDLLTSVVFAATVQKIVTEILPPSSGLIFGKDARDLLIECCVEFITLISSEANDISEKESKKTIACDHITKALEQLGFGAYVQEIMEVANEHKEQLKVWNFFKIRSLVGRV